MNKSEVIQFELNPSYAWRYSNNSDLSNQITVVPYDPNNKGSKFYTYKALSSNTSKAKLFYEAFNWLAEYKPNEKIEFIKFQLQGCKYKVKNNRANILGFFRRLKNLNKRHYENWSFKKFLKKVH